MLTSRAKLLEEQGHLEEAIAILEAARGISLPEDDARVTLCAWHNLADNLGKIDRFQEAEALLPEVRVLACKAGGELDRLRLKWTDGRVAAGLGAVEKGIPRGRSDRGFEKGIGATSVAGVAKSELSGSSGSISALKGPQRTG